LGLDLKVCLGIVLPNQYCPIIIWEMRLVSGDFTSNGHAYFLVIPTIVVHDISQAISWKHGWLVFLCQTN